MGVVLGELLLTRRGYINRDTIASAETIKSESSIVIGYRADITRQKAAVPETKRLLLDRIEAARALYARMKRESGRAEKVSLDGLPRPLRWLIQSLLDAVGEWWSDLAAGDMTLPEWVAAMRDALAEYHLAGFMAGNGSEDVSDKALGIVADQVSVQLDYLNGFKAELQSAAEFAAGAQARAESYAPAIKVPYWTGKTKVLPLPAMPAQGTQCMCISTPSSRVLTRRGWLPICEVNSGDMVMTHRGRWRMVLDTPIRSSQAHHQQAWVTGLTGKVVGCTSDHKWWTPEGWKSLKYICNSHLSMYTIPHDKENLHSMWDRLEQSQYIGPVQTLPAVLPDMWSAEGSSGSRMPILRHESQGQRAVADAAQNHYGWTSQSRDEALDTVREDYRRLELADQERWPALHVVSDAHGPQADGLPIPMALDQGAWTDTGRLCDSSQERGPHSRRLGQLRIDDSCCTQPAPFDRNEGAGNGRSVRTHLSIGQRTADLPAVREGFSPENISANTLLGEVFPVGTPLYDLTVEEDHSFVIEGLIAHNSNCKCQWEIKWVDEEAMSADCFWRRSAEDSCQTCLQREAEWSPVRIRDGVLE